jgi:signal transduction histidine kinase
MTAPRANRKPGFFWQGFLIVLPVVLLAGMACLSLRKDKMLAQREASERAQLIADDLLPRIWAAITNSNPSDPGGHSNFLEHYLFQASPRGQLVFPPPYSLPAPNPLNVAELNSSQAQLWLLVQGAQAAAGDPDAAVRAYREFIASTPPENFAAVAHYGLGLHLAQQGKGLAAAEMFKSVADKFPAAVGETGLPIRPFAQLKLLEMEAAGATNNQPAVFPSVDSFCSNAVYQPTLLTPYLLNVISEKAGNLAVSGNPRLWPGLADQPALLHPYHLNAAMQRASQSQTNTTIQDWQRLWENHEFSRRLFTAARRCRPFSCAFEFEGRNWVALRCDDTSASHWFICRSEPDLNAAVDEVLRPARQSPEYFGVGVELAGKKLFGLNRDLRVWREVPYNGKGSGLKKEYTADQATTILASATKTDAGADLLKINIYLTSPAMLFKLQNARTFWFGALIAASALAALLGLLAAWRAFHRQLQLSEMKSNFVASVSHELRAPIASVRLMAESLERGKISEPAKQNEYFRFIGQESRRLSSLIENVLDFSRIEQGRKQYEFEPTDLFALAQQTVKIMEPYAAERQINLAFHSALSTLHSTFSGDGRALQQALVNLLDNAIKHSPKGATVTVGLGIQNPESTNPSIQESINPPIQNPSSNTQDPDSRFTFHVSRPVPITHHASRITPSVTLYVEDSGPGIPPEEHEKIFERFYRLGSELRRETQGVGIGLSIVKHIVEAHGGRVVVRSAVGQGSRFTIELPAQPTTENNE